MTDRASKIKAARGTLEELKTQIKVSRQSRAEAKEALASAGALDAKAVSAFDFEISDFAANIDALTRAISALERNAAGSSFLQGGVGSAIRKLVMSKNRVSDDDHSTLLSFLSGGESQGNARSWVP